MNRPKLLGAIALVMLVGMGMAAGDALAANIVIVNNDGPGEGFNDATAAAPVGGNWGTTVGQQRLIAFEYAAGIWAACLESNVDIEVRAQFDPLFCNAGSATLGSAGTIFVFRDFAGAPAASTWYSGALANSLAGSDLSPADPEINATFNSSLNGNPACLGGTGWYYGLDGVPGSDIDFVSVLLHEMGHGLGFQTFVSQAGVKLAGFNDQYMIYLENHGAVPADYPSMSDAQRAAGNIADPNLHWTGPFITAEGNAILSGGISGGHVRMHGPNPYQPGSSVSHFSTALTPNELMEPSYTGANSNPSMAAVLMDEIGWNLQSKGPVCDGSEVDLANPVGPPPNPAGGQSDSNQGRGMYITAIKDFNLCAIGMEMDHVPGQTITANVYAANGITRGGLLATGSGQVPAGGLQMVYVPINYLLEECKEYDIEIFLGDAIFWPWWNDGGGDEPFDVGGVIRVRDGELNGNAGNGALPHFSLLGETPVPGAIADLSPVAGFTTCADGSSTRGVYITAARTISVSSIGYEYVAPVGISLLRANIYEATGIVRGPLLVSGTVEVVGGGGLQIYDIPVNAVLREGQDYDLEVEFTPGTWSCYSEGSSPTPFTIDDVIIVVNGEQAGSAGNTILPHLTVGYEEGSGGDQLDLVSPWHTIPISYPNSTQDNFDYGLYVSALKNNEIYSLGWIADVPVGEIIGANIYEATGTTRGALIASGTILSGAACKRWHDIPVAASLVAGQDYDLEIDIGQVDAWDSWSDSDPVGVPYTAYGFLEVVDGEQAGNPGNNVIIPIRVGACATTVTGIADGPTVAPRFTLAAPYPNPVSGSATLGISLDEAATVTVAVYDVAGRKVADLVQDQRFPVGPAELTFNSANLPSGVYFVKMSTPTKSVSRKITILR